MKYTNLGLHNVKIKVKYYCYFHVHVPVIFLQSVPQYAFKKKINYQFPTYLFTLASPFTKLYIELFWQNSSITFNEMNLTKWKCGTFLEDFFVLLPLYIQYFWEKPSWYKQNIVSICKILFLMTRLLCGKRRECLWSVYTSGNFKWIFLLSELYRKRMLPWWTLNLCWFKVSLCISF